MKVVMIITDARLHEDGAIGQAFGVDIAAEVVQVDACGNGRRKLNSWIIK